MVSMFDPIDDRLESRCSHAPGRGHRLVELANSSRASAMDATPTGASRFTIGLRHLDRSGVGGRLRRAIFTTSPPPRGAARSRAFCPFACRSPGAAPIAGSVIGMVAVALVERWHELPADPRDERQRAHEDKRGGRPASARGAAAPSRRPGRYSHIRRPHHRVGVLAARDPRSAGCTTQGTSVTDSGVAPHHRERLREPRADGTACLPGP